MELSADAAFVRKILETGEFELNDGQLPNRSSQDCEINAATIRSLLLGLPDPELGITGQDRIRRLELKGARIADKLDLTYAGPSDDGAPIPVILENCFFIEPIDMSHARLGRLSLRGSRFTEFKAHSARFAGAVDFSDIASSTDASPEIVEAGTEPIPDENRPGIASGECVIDLRGSRIEGGFEARRSKLQVGPDTAPEPGEAPPVALRMSNCVVAGEIVLDRTHAVGGVSLVSTQVDGNISAQSSAVSAWHDPYSFNLQLAHVRGSVILRPVLGQKEADPFRSNGTIRLYSTAIDGEIYCAGAELEPPLKEIKNDDNIRVEAYQAKIGQIRFIPLINDEVKAGFNWSGKIHIVNSRVESLTIQSLQADGEHREPQFRSLELAQSYFAGDVQISSVFDIDNISANWATFDADLIIQNVSCSTLRTMSARISGIFRLHQVTCKEDIDFSQASVGGAEFRHCHCQRLVLVNTQTDSDLIIYDFAVIELDLEGSKIGQNLNLQYILQKRPSVQFSLTGTKIGANCTLENITARSSLAAAQMQVGRDINIGDIKFEALNFDMMQLSLAGIRVDGTLRMHGNVKFKPLLHDSTRAREKELPFYRSWHLVEARLDTNPPSVIALLESRSQRLDSQFILLDGTSPPIHACNAERQQLDLTTEDKAREYLEFFCAYVWGEEGAFRLITHKDDLEFLFQAAGKKLEKIDEHGHLLHIPITRQEGGYLATAIVNYSNAIFVANFKIPPDGVIEMLDDRPIAIEISRDHLFGYSAPFRYAPPSKENEIVFEGHWNDSYDSHNLKAEYQGDNAFVVDLSASRIGQIDDKCGNSAQQNLKLSGLSFDLIDIDNPDHDQIANASDASSDSQPPTPHAGTSEEEAINAFKVVAKKRAPEQKRHVSAPDRAEERVKWLKRNKSVSEDVNVFGTERRRLRESRNGNEFDTYPYEQVANCYRRSGRSGDVLKILKAKSEQELKFWATDWCQDWCRDWRQLLVLGKRRDEEEKTSEEWENGALRSGKHWAAFLLSLSAVVASLLTVIPVVIILATSVLTSLLSHLPTAALTFDFTGHTDFLVLRITALNRFPDATDLLNAVAERSAEVALPLDLILLCVYFGPLVIRHLFCIFFDYGLSMPRALATVVGCVLVGWFGVEIANRSGVLVVATQPVQTHVVKTKDGGYEPRSLLEAGANWLSGGEKVGPDEIPCGQQIDSFLYALDVFLPLVDLRQEEQCRPTGKPEGSLWRIGKAVYALLGWVVVSLTIVMATGFLRRQSVE